MERRRLGLGRALGTVRGSRPRGGSAGGRNYGGRLGARRRLWKRRVLRARCRARRPGERHRRGLGARRDSQAQAPRSGPSASVRSNGCPGATRASTWSRASTPSSSPATSSPPSPRPGAPDGSRSAAGGGSKTARSTRSSRRCVRSSRHRHRTPHRTTRPRSASRGCSRTSRGERGSPPSARTRSRCRTSFPTARRSSARCSIAPILRIGPEVAERVVRTTVEADAEPFRRSDGSYRFENRFRYLIAVVP
jgi:hypothetical protein